MGESLSSGRGAAASSLALSPHSAFSEKGPQPLTLKKKKGIGHILHTKGFKENAILRNKTDL